MNLQEALKEADALGRYVTSRQKALLILAARFREMHAAINAIPWPCPVCAYSTMHAGFCVIGKAIECGDVPASDAISGRCVEAGDDAAGRPTITIHTTREELRRFPRNLVFTDVEVRTKP